MPNLLDLSDEILQNIAYFTNQDAYIPLPAFRPHWANFRLEIHPSLQTDFFNFRSTCRRLRSVCGLENLHWRINDTSQIGAWSNFAPGQVVKAVRRLYLVINPERGEQDHSGFAIWAMVTNLLNRLSVLEELIIDWTYCIEDIHHDFANQPFPLILPSYPILSNLKSLSIGTQCQHCKMTLARLLIPACPKIRHLKFQLDSWYDGEGEHDDPGDVLERLVEEWCKNNKQDVIPIETAYLKVPTRFAQPHPGGVTPENSITITARKAGEVFPLLKKLTMAPYEKRFLDTLMIRFLAFQVNKDEGEVKGKGEEGKAGEWEFTVFPEKNQSLNEYLSSLSEFPNLKLIDMSLEIIIDGLNRHPPLYPEIDHSFSSYLRLKRSARDYFLGNRPEAYKAQYTSALTSAANILLHQIPSLEGGMFWESGTEASYCDGYSWRWYTKIDHQSGKKVVKVDQDPLAVSEKFVTSRDGREAMWRVARGEEAWTSGYDPELTEWM